MPIDESKRPTNEEFSAYVKYLEDLWRDAAADMEELQALYFQTENIWAAYYKRNHIPESQWTRPSHQGGIAPALVDQAVAFYMGLEPQFHRGESKRRGRYSAEDISSRIEKGLQAAYYDAMVRTANICTVENGKQLQMYNYTILGVLLDLEQLNRPYKKDGESQEDFEEREHEWEMTHMVWNPIKLYVPAPGEVLMVPTGGNTGVAIRRQTMKAYELRYETQTRELRRTSSSHPRYAQSFVRVFDERKDPYEEVEVEQWWSAKWVVLREKGGEVLYSEPNTWGIQPWSQVFGGNATSPSGKFNVKWWIEQSFLWKAKDRIRMINQAEASYHSVVTRRAWATLGTKGDPAEMAAQLQTGMPQGDPEDLWMVPTPEMAPQSYQHLQELQEGLHRTTYSPMVAGFRQAGVDTATGMIILAEGAARTFAVNKIKLEHLHTNGGSNLLRLVDRLDSEYRMGPIEIGDAKLDAKDIARKYHIQATFVQVDAVARQQAIQLAMQMREAGIVGNDYVYQAAGIEDTAGTQADAIKTLAERDPMYLQQLIIQAYRADGMNELADQKQAELDMMKQQAAMQQRGAGQAAGPMTAQGATNGRAQQPLR